MRPPGRLVSRTTAGKKKTGTGHNQDTTVRLQEQVRCAHCRPLPVADRTGPRTWTSRHSTRNPDHRQVAETVRHPTPRSKPVSGTGPPRSRQRSPGSRQRQTGGSRNPASSGQFDQGRKWVIGAKHQPSARLAGVLIGTVPVTKHVPAIPGNRIRDYRTANKKGVLGVQHLSTVLVGHVDCPFRRRVTADPRSGTANIAEPRVAAGGVVDSHPEQRVDDTSIPTTAGPGVRAHRLSDKRQGTHGHEPRHCRPPPGHRRIHDRVHSRMNMIIEPRYPKNPRKRKRPISDGKTSRVSWT